MKFEIIDHGTLVGFTPASEDAQQWWDEHVQWCPMMGDQYLVESRYAGPILEGIKAASDKQQAAPSLGGEKFER
jgi:hypothetical protein